MLKMNDTELLEEEADNSEWIAESQRFVREGREHEAVLHYMFLSPMNDNKFESESRYLQLPEKRKVRIREVKEGLVALQTEFNTLKREEEILQFRELTRGLSCLGEIPLPRGLTSVGDMSNIQHLKSPEKIKALQINIEILKLKIERRKIDAYRYEKYYEFENKLKEFAENFDRTIAELNAEMNNYKVE